VSERPRPGGGNAVGTLPRRAVLQALAGAASAAALPAAAGSGAVIEPRVAKLAAEFERIERDVGGRLGVAVLAPDGAWVGGRRADEPFPMCSVFKLLLAAQVLARVDRGEERLERVVRYGRDALVTYSPVAERHVDTGLSVAALCEATVTLSDNAAANLLLAASGGPPALTRFVRDLGDPVTRLDRIEPALNEALPGDPRDTTQPRAMVRTIRRLLQDEVLGAQSRSQLERWLRDNRTGDARLRAGLPAGWQAGEKTGSGERGTTNDAGVLWAPDGRPWTVAAFLTECEAAPAQRNAALARVAAAVVAAVLAP
jgi:beta-lactamase class A